MDPKGPNSFKAATKEYRTWLGAQITLTDAAWKQRERRVATSTPFECLRATFYRWSQWWPTVCQGLNDAPFVLGIGDLHVENFGTWRDAEGRLVWGVNDLDECCHLPYTNDLVRLAASARFAMVEAQPATKKLFKTAKAKQASKAAIAQSFQQITQDIDPQFRAACTAIMGGYRDALDPQRPDIVRKPFVLAENKTHAWLREIVLNELRIKEKDRKQQSKFDRFLTELHELKNISDCVPLSAWQALNQSMPEPDMAFRIGKRAAGLGSLGRQRFTAVVDDWHGGILVREAKTLAPSAWLWWTQTSQNVTDIFCEELRRHAVRAPDPCMWLYGSEPTWIVRRLAPDSGKVKLKDLPRASELEDALLRAMGHETANVHVALGDVWQDLQQRNKKAPDWLYRYAVQMADKVMDDWVTL